MGKPYFEVNSWAFRLRVRGQDIYRSGFKSEAAARKAQNELQAEIENAGKAARMGPHATSLAVAFSDYARERLPFLKGAKIDANRINCYLRASGLPVVTLTKYENPESESTCYWNVAFAAEDGRIIPASLKVHRAKQVEARPRTEKMRARLATMSFADVTPHHVQQLIDAMQAEGYEPATIDHERAELRRIFNYAKKTWLWTQPQINPASPVKAPKVDNARNRVLTNAEWQKISKVLAEYDNPHVMPLLCLMLETAMRSCEPLTYARWGNIDWERKILVLTDGKAGKRDVPLNPATMSLLSSLLARAGSPALDTKIFPTTYEAVKKAWTVARRACGLDDVNLHDLRHTAATRYSLEFNGDVPVLKLITGHKTSSQLMRYINLKADDVVRKMHKNAMGVDNAPAGYQASLLGRRDDMQSEEKAQVAEGAPSATPQNVIRIDFKRRAA